MDQNERREDGKLTIDKDAQINVVVNTPDSGEDTIDLGRVFHNMKVKRRIFAWVLVLCLVVGIAAPLLMYQFNPPVLTVASVVTLRYEIPMARTTVNGREVLVPLAEYEGIDPEIVYVPVSDLTAPDGKELDLSLITSAYVLQNAVSGLDLSQPVTLANLRSNISIERVLTDESRRAQELASKMSDDKNSGAYEQIQSVSMKYDTKFVVRLSNGFGDEDSDIKYDLTDAELRALLDRILSAYNDYLVMTYADMKLPDDEIAVIDTENLDILESLELLRTASDDLLEYCERKPESVRLYRSSRDGRSLEDWMQTIRTGREVSIDYLYSDVYTNMIVRNRETMITSYQYQLRNAQTKLDTVNENIATTKAILEQYKNDEIFVSMQESDSSKSTKTTTDYYNELILQQSKNYGQVAALETQIADLKDKISNLSAGDATRSAAAASSEAVAAAEEELEKTVAASRTVYEGVKAHMQELFSSAFYTDYAEHTVPQGKVQNFLSASLKKMIIGGVVGAVLACGLWFLAALAPEFQRGRKEDDGKEAA